MARTYAYCEDPDAGPVAELQAYGMIHTYGVEAVTGRNVLEYREMVNMNLSRSVYDAYQSRARSESWATWAEKNPEENALLNLAMTAFEKTDEVSDE